MGIIDILSPARVAIDIAVTSKKATLEELARLVVVDVDELTPAQAFDGLVHRERLGSTGLGNGIAIPHGRIEHLSAMTGAFLRTSTPVDFDAVDMRPVDLFFALFVPKDTTDAHLAMLANLAECFSDEALVSDLRKGQSMQVVYDLLVGSAVAR